MNNFNYRSKRLEKNKTNKLVNEVLRNGFIVKEYNSITDKLANSVFPILIVENQKSIKEDIKWDY